MDFLLPAVMQFDEAPHGALLSMLTEHALLFPHPSRLKQPQANAPHP